MLRSLFHGLYEVLDVPARVSLRVLVQLLGSPLGLLAGREARDLLLPEEHHRYHLVTGLSQGTSVLPRFIVPVNISVHNAPGKGTFVWGGAEKPSLEESARASGTAR